MAFTTPGTAVAGSVLTSAFWNTNVRENTNAIRAAQVNVLSATMTGIQNTTSAAFVDITDGTTPLSVTITPSSATSKILILASVNVSFTYPSSQPQAVHLRLTGGNSSTDYRGNAAGSRERAAYSIQSGANFVPADSLLNAALMFLDSPATASAITYKAQIKAEGNTTGGVTVNNSRNDSDLVRFGRNASTITVMEIPV
jgi:hypothetical protein